MGGTILDHEMIVPALGAPFFSEHLARYFFARKFAKDKDVLDVACGNGYGSMALSTVANSVTGIDLDDRNLKFAAANYAHPRIRFESADVTKLQESKRYDVAVAYEVYEHLEQHDADNFLSGIARALRPGGIALLSTPNHAVVQASGVPVPHFHINNVSSIEFKERLSKHFSSVEMLGQIRSRGPIGNILLALDIFHLRHKLPKRAHVSVSGEEPFTPSMYWRPEQGWGDSAQYIFSSLYWRQAGLSLAVCRTANK